MGNYENTMGKILYLPMGMVKPGQSARGDYVKLQELAASIKELGILQPLTVRKNGEGYTVVSGNRRYAAARMAGLGVLPCLLLDVEAEDACLIGLTENLQREDLHYFEEAELIQQYLCHCSLTQAQAAKKLGRSQPALANKMRLLQHSGRVRQRLRELGLSERHARALLRVPGETERLAVLEEIGEKQLSVAQTERYIEIYLNHHRTGEDSRFQKRDARLFLSRVARDTELLRVSGVPASCETQEDQGEIVLTVRMGSGARSGS